MPSKVYNNIEGNRVLDNKLVMEDVTSVTMPTISHPTTTINASGMIMDVEMPNIAHLEAMELSVAHNNGVNCEKFADPGKHKIEVRVVRQRYNVTSAEIEHESVKFRLTCVHKSTDKGNIENGNPYGSTEKFTVLRYEEEVNGEITIVADAMAGKLTLNGKDVVEDIEKLLK